MLAVITADVHAGKKAYGLSVQEWVAPLLELVEQANAMNAKVLFVAGDLLDKRDPSVETVTLVEEALRQFNGAVVIATGNHELRAPSTNNAMYLIRKPDQMFAHQNYDREQLFRIMKVDGYHVGILNWATLEFFPEIEKTDTLQEQLQQASELVIKEIDKAMAEKGIEKLDLITGHAHIYYGLTSDDEPAPAPNLLAGRDILLPATALTQRSKHVYLGHVHSWKAQHYCGSLQPTDRADTERKGYYSLDFATDEVTRHTLQSSLKITAWKFIGVDHATVIGTINSKTTQTPPGKVELLRIILDNSELEEAPNYDYVEIRNLALEAGFYNCEIEQIPPARKVRMSNKDGAVMPMWDCVETWLDNRGEPQTSIDKVRTAILTLQEE